MLSGVVLSGYVRLHKWLQAKGGLVAGKSERKSQGSTRMDPRMVRISVMPDTTMGLQVFSLIREPIRAHRATIWV